MAVCLKMSGRAMLRRLHKCFLSFHLAQDIAHCQAILVSTVEDLQYFPIPYLKTMKPYIHSWAFHNDHLGSLIYLEILRSLWISMAWQRSLAPKWIQGPQRKLRLNRDPLPLQSDLGPADVRGTLQKLLVTRPIFGPSSSMIAFQCLPKLLLSLHFNDSLRTPASGAGPVAI